MSDVETRVSRGVGAAAMLKAALEAPGRPGRLVRLLTQIAWRRGTRILVDGADLGNAADQVEIVSEDRREPHCTTTTVTRLEIAGIPIPLSRRSRRLTDHGRGVWSIGDRRIEIVQPDDERHTFQ